MLDKLVEWDKSLFIVMNNFYCEPFDAVMLFITEHFSWIPLYVAILFFLFWKRNLKTGLLAFLALLLIFGLTDQLSVHLFKNTIQRLRPCHEEELRGIIRVLESCGGRFGFISNHAANTFGLATFTALFFQRKWYAWSILIWAAIVSYSRIYVGKHYPLDLLCGALFGILTAYLVYRLYRLILEFRV
jgi:undecaprenyl-diphosphatase